MFVTAAFSFAGTELVGLAATETPNPRKAMPSAIKQTFWRITLVYITSLVIIGLTVPYNDKRLLGGGGADTSPFVIVMDKAKIKGLNHLINVTICISVLSIGLSCVYAGSRTLTALAETGYAPKIFAYVDKAGRPLWSVVAILAFSPLAYINLAAKGGEVFNWLVALSGLSTLFSWLAICITHIRFRRAWKVQGHSVEELPFRAIGGAYGSMLGAALIVIVLIAQFYIAVWPIGGNDSPQAAAETFFRKSASLIDLTSSLLPRFPYHPPLLGYWLRLEACPPPSRSRDRPRHWPKVVALRRGDARVAPRARQRSHLRSRLPPPLLWLSTRVQESRGVRKSCLCGGI